MSIIFFLLVKLYGNFIFVERFPNLSVLYTRIYNIPAAGTLIEQLYSVSGVVSDKKRASWQTKLNFLSLWRMNFDRLILKINMNILYLISIII